MKLARPSTAGLKGESGIESSDTSSAQQTASRSGAKRPGYWSQVLLTAAPLLLSDAVAVGVSVACASFFVPLDGTHVESLWLLLTVLTVVLHTLLHMYPGTGMSPVTELQRASMAAVGSCLFMQLSMYSFGNSTEVVFFVAGSCLTSLVAIPVLRGLARSAATHFSWWGQPTLICGRGEMARRLYQYYLSNPRFGLRPVGTSDQWSQESNESGPQLTKAQNEPPGDHVNTENIFWAVATTPLSASTIRSCSEKFAHVLVTRKEEDVSPSLRDQVTACAGLSSSLMTNRLLLPLPRRLKRLTDVLLAITVGLLSLPLILTIAATIKLTSRGPAFFSQERLGKGEMPFQAWKFRTMVIDSERVLEKYLENDPELQREWESDHKLRNDPRITKVGSWLRKTSLDELPQIWNVIRGEMSVVGPRPIVGDEVSKYGKSYELYSRVLPGITGLWQISGRNNTTYDERVLFDSYYALHWSPWLDLLILTRTVGVVLSRDGAY